MDTKRWATSIAVAIIFSGIALPMVVQAEDAVILIHVHGLGFSADGSELVIPSHHGLAVYRDGRWSKAPGPQHDYMGFVATSRGYYSSGHPAPGSGLVNPFGLMRSDDNAKTWTKLGLEGQSDFHIMAASFRADAVYVYNVAPNARMNRPGLYSTLNDGLDWRRADASGLSGDILSLAVHPTDPNTVAAGTAIGLFVSHDGGAHFSRQLANVQVPGLMFDHDGATLWASTFDAAAHLLRIDWKRGQKTESALPPLGQDAVAYMAQNPRDAQQLAIATFARSVFLSRDRGMTWKQIADRGRTL
jgi:hypothetical protein